MKMSTTTATHVQDAGSLSESVRFTAMAPVNPSLQAFPSEDTLTSSCQSNLIAKCLLGDSVSLASHLQTTLPRAQTFVDDQANAGVMQPNTDHDWFEWCNDVRHLLQSSSASFSPNHFAVNEFDGVLPTRMPLTKPLDGGDVSESEKLVCMQVLQTPQHSLTCGCSASMPMDSLTISENINDLLLSVPETSTKAVTSNHPSTDMIEWSSSMGSFNDTQQTSENYLIEGNSETQNGNLFFQPVSDFTLASLEQSNDTMNGQKCMQFFVDGLWAATCPQCCSDFQLTIPVTGQVITLVPNNGIPSDNQPCDQISISGSPGIEEDDYRHSREEKTQTEKCRYHGMRLIDPSKRTVETQKRKRCQKVLNAYKKNAYDTQRNRKNYKVPSAVNKVADLFTKPCKGGPDELTCDPVIFKTFNNVDVDCGYYTKEAVVRPKKLPEDHRSCCHCRTKQTTLWRRDIFGRNICNACKLYMIRNQRIRPQRFTRRTMRGRQRIYAIN